MTTYKRVQRAKVELESTVDSVAQLICVLGKDGRVSRLNKTFECWGLGQGGLGKVQDVSGKCLHQLMHPACTNAKCYLQQLIVLSNKVITTGEPAEYSGFDSELNRSFLVQMIPVGPNDAISTEKIEHLNQLVMIFFDITQPDFFNPALENLNRWHQIDATPKAATLAQKKSPQSTLNSNKIPEIKFEEIEKIKREWELAIDVLPQIICLVDTDGKIARANRAIESWGLGNVTHIKGRHVHDMLHPDCIDDQCYLLGFNQLIADVLATGKSAECQVLDEPLNRHLQFQMNAVPSHSPLTRNLASSRSAKNNFVSSHYVVVLVCDVTDVKHAELKIEHLNTKLEKRIEARARHLQKINQQLQAEIEQRKLIEIELTISRQKFSHLVELMNEGMVIQDLNKKITYANKHLLKMLGLPRAEVVGHYFTDFVDVDYLDTWNKGKH